jgi:hypothetical protein
VRLSLAFCVVCLLTAGCVDLNTQDTSVTTWEGQLAPDPAHPDLSGQVAAAVQLGGTDAGIGIAGAAPNAAHLWGLWSGSCTRPGSLIGTSDDYPVLAVGDSGKASAETRLGVRLSSDSTYHAELLESAAAPNRIACGNLQQR